MNRPNKTFIDFFRCVITDDGNEGFLALISKAFSDISYKVVRKEEKGRDGYRHLIEFHIPDAAKGEEVFASICYGDRPKTEISRGTNQRGTCLLNISGSGCSLVYSWRKVHDVLTLDPIFHITVLHITYDVYEGDWIKDVYQRWMASPQDWRIGTTGRLAEFTHIGGDPKILNLNGHTLNYGLIKNGCQVQIYQKGIQFLKNKYGLPIISIAGEYEPKREDESFSEFLSRTRGMSLTDFIPLENGASVQVGKWLRYEVKITDKKSYIPHEAMYNSDPYFCVNKITTELLSDVAPIRRSPKLKGVKEFAPLVHMKRQYGKSLYKSIKESGILTVFNFLLSDIHRAGEDFHISPSEARQIRDMILQNPRVFQLPFDDVKKLANSI